ncbi:hypothetical protein ACFL4D_00360 [Candidatus Margulisiibacteriota bacterium]
MNVLLEYSTLTARFKHGLAIQLKKLYPQSTFVGTVTSLGNTEAYLREQTDIKYEALYDLRKLPAQFLQQPADLELIREFEQTLEKKSIWRLIAMDRDWGYQYVKSSYRPHTRIHFMNNQENIMKVVSGYIKFYQKLLSKYKIQMVIPANGMNNLSCPILEQVCKNMNIPYLFPETLRTLNYMALTPNKETLFPQIDETYREMMAEAKNTDMSKGEELYKEMIESIETQEYFDKTPIDHLKSSWPKTKFVFLALRGLAAQLLRWHKERKIHRQAEDIHRQSRNFKTLWSNIVYSTLGAYQRMKLFDKKFYQDYDPQQKYIYFPLQCTPEYSTQVRATMWINPLPMIEALSKSVPAGWRIFVKEHPITLSVRVRDLAFYQEVKKYPNVDFVPISTNSEELINNAQLVINVAGTTGWEAILRGKPVLSFSNNFYDVLDLSVLCTDTEALSVAIYNEIQRIKEISSGERKQRMICFFSAMMKHAFWISHPYKITGDMECTEEDAVEIGKTISMKIKEYLEQNHYPGKDN